ncbi:MULTISPECIES: helix-turn-helix domain-containing protein [Streptomyces]|uniref:helix-turn-helix domain-containing protein n=1 Tax=Streptomyces TaxID=1883 RepID=UPI00057116D1|nr:helix-turn-helix transcriptional regulator [Streptomyces noursei]MCE4947481.1 helix-turn-helix domain-containing protein [Streptomyces noursei]MCZ0973229.1 helix-turn-helix transcriptional regulator [Streptomyces noursei]
MNKRTLNPDASLQAAYGARLRSMREARGWTQEELADRTEYSAVHISAVETGRKPPTLRFSRSTDRAFGLVGTADTFERQFREITNGNLLEGFPEYVKYEGRAAEIRLYEIGIVPGLLQTPEYARVLADSALRRGTITAEQAEERVAFLAERQAALERPRLPTMLVVMDESCVRRQVGGPEVMRAQLDQLVQFAELPNIVLQIAPYAIGERRTFDLPMNLLTMSDLSVVAYAESQLRGHLERDTAAVLPLLTAYHQLQAEALPQAASVAMINEARKGTL